jgi:cytochrome-b5 reductase
LPTADPTHFRLPNAAWRQGFLPAARFGFRSPLNKKTDVDARDPRSVRRDLVNPLARVAGRIRISSKTMFAALLDGNGMDVEALVLTVAAVCVGLVVLLDVLSKSLKPKKTLVDPDAKVSLPLIERKELSHDTHLFRFALPSKEHCLGLPVGQHVTLSYVDADGKEQGRPYTPTSSDHDLGVVDFVIKVYFPNERFPEGGKVSQHMHSLKIGDTLDFQGPKGRYEYRGRGVVRDQEAQEPGRRVRDSARQARGHDRRRERDHAHDAGEQRDSAGQERRNQGVSCSSRTRRRATSCSATSSTPRRRRTARTFAVHYTVDKAPKKWKYDEGFITAEMIKQHLPPPGKDTQILLCGPPPMLKFAVMPAFEKLGYTKDMFLQW